jgi:hypothetical protein
MLILIYLLFSNKLITSNFVNYSNVTYLNFDCDKKVITVFSNDSHYDELYLINYTGNMFNSPYFETSMYPCPETINCFYPNANFVFVSYNNLSIKTYYLTNTLSTYYPVDFLNIYAEVVAYTAISNVNDDNDIYINELISFNQDHKIPHYFVSYIVKIINNSGTLYAINIIHPTDNRTLTPEIIIGWLSNIGVYLTCDNNNNNNNDSKIPHLYIIIIISIVLFLVLFFMIFYFFCKRRNINNYLNNDNLINNSREY